MTAKELIDALNTVPPTTEIRLAIYEDGKTNRYHVSHAINTEHQQQIGEFWLTRTQGIPAESD